jgi:hypothetical protein
MTEVLLQPTVEKYLLVGYHLLGEIRRHDYLESQSPFGACCHSLECSYIQIQMTVMAASSEPRIK